MNTYAIPAATGSIIPDTARCIITVTRPEHAREAIASTTAWRRIIVEDNEPRQGPAAAKNAGIQAALDDGAEWIRLCDDDDIIDPNGDTPLAARMQSTSADLLYFNVRREVRLPIELKSKRPLPSWKDGIVKTFETSYSGDFSKDIFLGWFTTNFVVSAKGLRKVHEATGTYFPQSGGVLGARFALAAFKAGLVFEHLPTVGYLSLIHI